MYAVPATVQFMNHADDRLRGMSTNPFKLKAEAVILGKGGKEKGNGPFPGDDILYGFKLFADSKRTKPIGSALFTCYYEFVKRATCDSYFDLARGLLLASGQVPFGGTHFSLGITGGTRNVLRRARASELRAGRRERAEVQPPRERAGQVIRSLCITLVAVALTATLAGCGDKAHKAGERLRGRTSSGAGGCNAESYVRRLRQGEASAIRQPCRRSRARRQVEPVQRGGAANPSERQHGEEGGPGRRQRAHQSHAIRRP